MKNYTVDTLEKLRLILFRWNAAPLSVVLFLCWVVWTLIEYYKTVACTIDPISQSALFVFLGGIGGLLYKMYDSMQRNKDTVKEEEK